MVSTVQDRHYSSFVMKVEEIKGASSIYRSSSMLIILLTGSLTITVSSPGWVGTRVTEVPAIAS